MKQREPGFMSYTKDPSLRRLHHGPIVPMEGERRSGGRWGLIAIAILIGGLFACRAFF